MNTIDDIWAAPILQGLDRLVAVRCKRDSVDERTHARNRKWLPEGRTGWWRLDDREQFGAIAVLLDSEASHSLIEVWVGRTPPGSDSGRFQRAPAGREWELHVVGQFELVDVIKSGTMTSFFHGKQIGNTVTYFERRFSSATPSSNAAGKRGEPRFRPEFVGEKGTSNPGSYTPDSKHGRVVLALHDWAKRRGMSGLNNEQRRDLQGIAPEGSLHLFEVKTSACAYDIHTAVGQLIVYEARSAPSVKTLVLPANSVSLNSMTELCRKIGISLLLYREENDAFEFDYSPT